MSQSHVIIIGGGIVGCACAQRLAALAPRPGMTVEAPPLRKRPVLTMRDMGMDMTGMQGMTMDMSMRNPKNAPGVTLGPGVQTISPMAADRDNAHGILGAHRMLEVYLSTPLEVCERRDPKGLYRRARSGEITDFTGISAPYQAPCHAQLVLDTGQLPLADCTARVLQALNDSN